MMASGQATAPRVGLERNPARIALVGIIGASAGLLLLLPFVAIFYYALRDGVGAYVRYLSEPSTLHSIYLSLLAVAVAAPINTTMGLAAAWLVGKHEFRGRKLLAAMIELPLSISPVVIGVAYLLLFGMQGMFGAWLMDRDILLIFNVPAILIVTTMVTTPYVFRSVLPLMQAQGTFDEQAALTLGANGWQTFWRVTLPNVRWGLLYGISLCMARALGEFGSVAVVSGAIRNQTNTMSLQIELLFDDFVQTGAFAVASLLTFFALISITLKFIAERKFSGMSRQ